jgi:hypothetical protein
MERSFILATSCPWTNVLLLAGPDYVLARDSQESIR